MSRDAALSFLKMAMQDESLQKKILELAKAEGYQFSVDELTEEELDQAAGGFKLESPLLTTQYKVEQPAPIQTIQTIDPKLTP